MGDRSSWIGGGAGAVLFLALFAAGQPELAYAALVAGGLWVSITASLSLNWQILIGATLGVALGVIEGSDIELVGVVGRVFIALLKMLIVPMIFFSIAAGISSMSGAAQIGRIGLRTLALYLATMAAAVFVALVLVNAVQPGASGSLRESAFFSAAIGTGTPDAAEGLTLGRFLLETVFQVLANPFGSLAQGRILPIVGFAILLGIALLGIGSRARALIEVIDAGNAAVMYLVRGFLRVAPVGVFALIGHLVATVGFRALFENLLAFAGVVIAGTLFHAFVTLPLFARVVAGIGPRALFRGIREAMVVAFSTSSSAATLPVTTRCVEDNLNVSPSVSSFVLPLGATVNMDGTALYEAIAAVFVANVYGIDLSLGGQIVVFIVAMVTAIGAPGIPSAGMVTMVVVLEAVGLPAEAVGVLLTIDRFLDTFRTMANVEGDAVVAVCVQASSGLAG